MKKLLWIIGTLVGLIIAGGIGLKAWLGGQLTPAGLVQLIEAKTNARVQIGSVAASLFSSPAEIIITDLQLAPRDTELSKDYATRTALAPGAALISVPKITLQADVLSLRSKPVIELLQLDQLNLRNEISKEGEDPLAQLFRKKAAETAVAVAPTPEPTVEHTANAPAEEPTAPEPTAPEPAQPAQPMSQEAVAAPGDGTFLLKKLVIASATLHVVDRRTKIKYDATGLQLTLTDISPDSDLISKGNLQSHLKVVGRQRLAKDQEPQEVNYAEGNLTANTELLLTPEGPSGIAKLTLAQGTKLAGYSKVGQQFRGVDQWAPAVADLTLGGQLQQPLEFEMKLTGTRTELQKEALLELEQYGAALKAGSWLDSAEEDHGLQLTVLVPPSLAGTGIASLAAALMPKRGDRLEIPVPLGR
jgi:hypothetical protein